MQEEAKQELSTEEVDELLKTDRAFVKLPAAVGTNFVMDEIVAFARTLEEACGADGVDIIVFNSQLLEHVRIPKSQNAKWRVLDAFLHRTHLDLLPYAEVIISVAQSDAAAMSKARASHGINDSYVISGNETQA